MTNEQNLKIEQYRERVLNSSFPLEDINADVDIWSYAVGWAWGVIYNLKPIVFAGINPHTTLTQRIHSAEKLHNLILNGYKKVNNRLDNNKYWKIRVIVACIACYVETEAAKNRDVNEELVIYGYNHGESTEEEYKTRNIK